MKALLNLVVSVVYQNCYKRFYEIPLTKHLKRGILLLFVEFVVLTLIHLLGGRCLLDYYGIYCSGFMIYTLLMVKRGLIKLQKTSAGTLIQKKVATSIFYTNALIILYAVKIIAEVNYWLLWTVRVTVALVWLDLIIFQTIIDNNYKTSYQLIQLAVSLLNKKMWWVICCYLFLNVSLMVYVNII